LSKDFGEDAGNVEYTLLNEQSFSDFGDSDLVIIAEKGVKKTVVFIEGKVKTSQGSFSLDINLDTLKDGFSSNIFVQLYYKCLLTLVLKEDTIDTSVLKNLNDIFKKGENANDRKIGKNAIVLKAVEMIREAQHYYFVAILPLDIKSEDFQKEFDNLKLDGMPTEDVRCAYWGKIEALFKGTIVDDTFDYNKEQIY
jgi:hypothetical protein